MLSWSRAFSCWPVRWTRWICRYWMRPPWRASGCCRYIDRCCRATLKISQENMSYLSLKTTQIKPVCLASSFSPAGVVKYFLLPSFSWVFFLLDRIASQHCVDRQSDLTGDLLSPCTNFYYFLFLENFNLLGALSFIKPKVAVSSFTGIHYLFDQILRDIMNGFFFYNHTSQRTTFYLYIVFFLFCQIKDFQWESTDPLAFFCSIVMWCASHAPGLFISIWLFSVVLF